MNDILVILQLYKGVGTFHEEGINQWMWFLNHSGTAMPSFTKCELQSKCTYRMHNAIMCSQSSHACLDQHMTERRFICLITVKFHYLQIILGRRKFTLQID